MSEAVTHETESLPETANHVAKIALADQARLMADNQRLLDRVAQAETWDRDYGRRVREAEAKRTFGLDWKPAAPPPEAEDVHVYIDSPVTISQPAPSPAPAPAVAAAAAQTPLVQKLAPWIVAAAMAGGGASVTSLWQQSAKPSATPPAAAATDAASYEFGLLPPAPR